MTTNFFRLSRIILFPPGRLRLDDYLKISPILPARYEKVMYFCLMTDCTGVLERVVPLIEKDK